MEKILVNVYVPLLRISYDVFIPQESQMHEVLGLIKKAIKELSDGRFFSDHNTIICDRRTGQILDINKSVYELKVKNGSKLMLI